MIIFDREECEADDNKPLCIADFGKVMKLVFPKIVHRRLGQRGESKYPFNCLLFKKLFCVNIRWRKLAHYIAALLYNTKQPNLWCL